MTDLRAADSGPRIAVSRSRAVDSGVRAADGRVPVFGLRIAGGDPRIADGGIPAASRGLQLCDPRCHTAVVHMKPSPQAPIALPGTRCAKIATGAQWVMERARVREDDNTHTSGVEQ